jgi:pyruvate,water dikinase
LQDYTQLGASGAPAYGVKAANLGELFHVLPADNRVPGFGIPFSVYRDFRDGSDIGARITAFLADPRTAADATFRRTGLADLQKAILAAPLPDGLLDRIRQAARAAFGEGYATIPLKFRSTSSGAGLYDSARGCFADDDDGNDTGPSACVTAAEHADVQVRLDQRVDEWTQHPERDWIIDIITDLKGDLTKERSVARAVRKVFASLWNERAFEERAYFGMNQADVLMGIAVDPSFVLERADAVVLTNLPASDGAPLTRVVSQSGGNPVVRPPDPLQVAEVMTFRRGPDDGPTDVRMITSSSLSPQPIWDDAHLATLSTLLATIQDHFASNVYPDVLNLSLDLEVKLTADDRVVIKQVRPYQTAGLTEP